MDIVPQKTCTKCKQTKPLHEFSQDKRLKDGRHSQCKTCVNQRRMDYYAAHTEQEREVMKRYRIHGATGKRRLNESAEAAQERTKENSRKRYWSNRDQIMETRRAQYKANPLPARLHAQKWRKANPVRRTAAEHRRRARKYQNGGTYIEQQWQCLKQQYNYYCLCCHRQEPDISLTVDHVIPVSLGGPNTIDNIQPLCLSCNAAKGNRHTTDYRRHWTPHGVSQASLFE